MNYLYRFPSKQGQLCVLAERCLISCNRGVPKCMIWTSVKPLGLEWNKAVSDAEKIVGYPTSFMNLRCLLSDEIANVAMHMRKLVGTKHPLLKTARGLVYDGKYSLQARGLIVLLLSKAAGYGEPLDQDQLQDKTSGILPSQRSLAEITEMIHTANLIHKGVVNLADLLPQDGPLQDMEFGNKMAVLSGDFLLANACTGLADLRNTQVVETVSSAIKELMEAEFSEFKDHNGDPILKDDISFSEWEEMTYLSSGSLLAKSCQSALKLGNHSTDLQQKAYEFGLNMAYAHQLLEDLKPFTQPEDSEGVLNILTAPVISHIDSCRENGTLEALLSDHKESIHLPKLYSAVCSGPAVETCQNLCIEYGRKATQALQMLKPSDAKSALINIIKAVTQI